MQRIDPRSVSPGIKPTPNLVGIFSGGKRPRRLPRVKTAVELESSRACFGESGVKRFVERPGPQPTRTAAWPPADAEPAWSATMCRLPSTPRKHQMFKF
jgi:hypothetical protein